LICSSDVFTSYAYLKEFASPIGSSQLRVHCLHVKASLDVKLGFFPTHSSKSVCLTKAFWGHPQSAFVLTILNIFISQTSIPHQQTSPHCSLLFQVA